MKNLLLILAFSTAASAQIKIFITPMDAKFDSFLSAAIIDKKVPVIITTDETLADFVLTTATAKGDNKWSDTLFGYEKDRNQGSVQVINTKDKSIVFAAAAGDRSFWFAGIKKTGQKKVAERLTDQLKKFFAKQPRPIN